MLLRAHDGALGQHELGLVRLASERAGLERIHPFEERDEHGGSFPHVDSAAKSRRQVLWGTRTVFRHCPFDVFESARPDLDRKARRDIRVDAYRADGIAAEVVLVPPANCRSHANGREQVSAIPLPDCFRVMGPCYQSSEGKTIKLYF